MFFFRRGNRSLFLAAFCALLSAGGIFAAAVGPDAQSQTRAVQRRLAADVLPEEKVARPNPEVDQYVRKQMKSQRLVGLALGVIRNGQVTYLKGYGWQDREGRVTVASRKTLFRWASISKTLTAIAALQLAREGKLDLEREISAYLSGYTVPSTYLRRCESGTLMDGNKAIPCVEGFFELTLKPEERSITMRILLGHLAGVMHYSNGKGNPVPPVDVTGDPNQNQGFVWALEYFVGKPLVSKPREEYHYTTFGFNLAGAVVEKAGGEPFAQQVKERIAVPANMTTLRPDYEWKTLPHRAVGYQRKVERPQGSTGPGRLAAPRVTIVRQGSTDVSWKLPGGGFISTVEDMARYCGALMGNALLVESEKDLAWTSQKDAGGTETGYGLGFGVGERNGRRRVSHGGSQEKTRTQLSLYPDDRLCVVVMSNSTNANVNRIANGVEDVVRSQPVTQIRQ